MKQRRPTYPIPLIPWFYPEVRTAGSDVPT
jgi:hypothetical protein